MSWPTSYRLWLKPKLSSSATSLKNGSGRPGGTEHGMSDLNSATRDAGASAVRPGFRSFDASSAVNLAEGMLLGMSREEIDALEVATSRRSA